MGLVTGIAVYLCIWWVVIFAVLPLGIRSAPPNDEGFDAGAPANPQLPRKVLITTIVSAVIWVAIYLLVTSNLFSFREP